MLIALFNYILYVEKEALSPIKFKNSYITYLII